MGAPTSQLTPTEETLHVTEHATRADDRMSEAAMEDRKKQGYF